MFVLGSDVLWVALLSFAIVVATPLAWQWWQVATPQQRLALLGWLLRLIGRGNNPPPAVPSQRAEGAAIGGNVTAGRDVAGRDQIADRRNGSQRDPRPHHDQ